MDRVKDKVAIVTGGALGIGRATCCLLSRAGAHVAVTDVLDEEGRKTVNEIQNGGGTAEYWHQDVSQEAEVARVFAEIARRFCRIDVLNNAGISGVNKPTHEVTESEWDRLMAVNVKRVFFCTKHVVAYMKQGGRGGSIINLSSIYGIVGAGRAFSVKTTMNRGASDNMT